MSRSVPAAIATLAAADTVTAVRLLRIGPISGTTFYFCEGSVKLLGGITYLPYLDFTRGTGTRYTLSIADGTSCKVALDNVDLATVDFIRQNRDLIQGSPAVLTDYYLEAGDELVLQYGEVVDVEVDDARALFTIAGFDPNTIQIPIGVYSQRCNWKYKGVGCPSASGLPTCNKSFANCAARVATQGFSGILTITDTLQASVTPSTPPLGAGRVGGGGDGSPDPRVSMDLN